MARFVAQTPGVACVPASQRSSGGASPDSHAPARRGRLRMRLARVVKSGGVRMKLHDHQDCSCHGAATGGPGLGQAMAAPPSTGFFVLSLSLSLLLCGLISTGVIPLRFW